MTFINQSQNNAETKEVKIRRNKSLVFFLQLKNNSMMAALKSIRILLRNKRGAMKSDKEFFKLFSACPKMLFDITGIEMYKSYTMTSITFKELEQRMDGYMETNDIDDPVYFAEFQGYYSDTIYQRITKGMAIFSENNPKRQVRGMIIFTKKSLDPKTEPWYLLTKIENSPFQVFYLDDILEELENKNPEHPLLLVFKPFLIDDEAELESQSKEWYSKLQQSTDLSDQMKDTFNSVFINWMMERFKNYSYEEVLAMVESLTPLEETRAYKELVSKGREEEKIAIAKKMLNRGDEAKSIMEVTELSLEELEKLKNNL